jgi:sugar transferase (PEP-CTERM system associated)
MQIRIFGHFLHLPLLALAAVEALAFAVALLSGVALRLGTNLPDIEQSGGPLWARVLLFVVVNLLCFLAMGLYTTRQRSDALGIGIRLAISIISAFAVLAALSYLIPAVHVGRGVLTTAALFVALLTLVIRTIASRVMHIEGMKRRVLAYGNSARLSAFTRMRRRSDRIGYHLVGVIHHEGDEVEPLGETVLDAPQGLAALCKQMEIDELVMALNDRRGNIPYQELLECRLAGVSVLPLINFMERETGRIQLDLLTPSWMIFGEGFRRDSLRLFTARTLDFLASILLLAAASPFMLITMAAIWLEDGRKGGGLFYRQNRVGIDGKVFPLLKFRSMGIDAEADGAQWAQKDDPRVTRVGAFIRKTRIDELPQLFNVLRGHMGFVGPRPERPEFVERLAAAIPYYGYRHSVKPGITGWAQLCYPYGSSIDDAREKLQYDLYYVKNHNLLFDISILIQTVEVVLLGKGAR